jgi:hypothetical protein
MDAVLQDVADHSEDDDGLDLSESANARRSFMCRERQSLIRGIGDDPGADEIEWIREIAETTWEKRMALRRARLAAKAGDTKQARDDRQLYSQHRTALIVLKRELRQATNRRRDAHAAEDRPSDANAEAVAYAALRNRLLRAVQGNPAAAGALLEALNEGDYGAA